MNSKYSSHPHATAADTIVSGIGGIDDIAAKGGFLMPDGTVRYYVVCPAVPWRRVEQHINADEGIEITITPDGAGCQKVTAKCHGAIQAIKP